MLLVTACCLHVTYVPLVTTVQRYIPEHSSKNYCIHLTDTRQQVYVIYTQVFSFLLNCGSHLLGWPVQLTRTSLYCSYVTTSIRFSWQNRQLDTVNKHTSQHAYQFHIQLALNCRHGVTKIGALRTYRMSHTCTLERSLYQSVRFGESIYLARL